MKDKDLFLEKLILEEVKLRQCKIALVVSEAISHGYSESEAGGKIYMMCVEGRLIAHGNILKWRHSEISLPKNH